MIRLLSLLFLAFTSTVFSLSSNAQWTQVLEDVMPARIVISPDYYYDQTLYVVDGRDRIFISETSGSVWVQIYEAADPDNPSETIHDLVVSPNFVNDNAIFLIHRDGSARFSYDRGQQWQVFPVPEGTSGIAFSPTFADDAKMYCITGILGPVGFYRSHNGGASWAKISDITIGGGYYSRIRNSTDTAAKNIFAIQYEPKKLFFTRDGGSTFAPSFEGVVELDDFLLSPKFSTDSTVFLSDPLDIWRSTEGGKILSWVNVESFMETSGVQLAISPTFLQDRTLYAAVDRVGVLVSTDGGENYTDFNDGLLSTAPISIAISQAHPYTLYAGTQGPGGANGGVWRYQTTSGTGERPGTGNIFLNANPNPFTNQTEISFELTKSGPVTLGLYDHTGRQLSVLFDGDLSKGLHHFTVDAGMHGLGAGMYIVRLNAGTDAGAVKVIRN